MDHQLHPKPQCRCQGESPENNDQETAGVGHRPDPNPNLHRERLCAVVLSASAGSSFDGDWSRSLVWATSHTGMLFHPLTNNGPALALSTTAQSDL